MPPPSEDTREHKRQRVQYGHTHGRPNKNSDNIHHHSRRIPSKSHNAVQAFGHILCARQAPFYWSMSPQRSSNRIGGGTRAAQSRNVPYHSAPSQYASFQRHNMPNQRSSNARTLC